MPDYSAEERNTIALATFGSVALVASEGGGLVTKAREGVAGLRTLGKEAGWLVKAMEHADVASEIATDSAELEPKVMAALPQAASIVAIRDPEHAGDYRPAVIAAMTKAAKGGGGVNDDEAAVIAKVKQALGVS